jgi:protein-tyrosine phosphatase
MAKIKIKVLSHYLFDEDMKQMGLNDANVENFNKAFISIIGTPECLKYYLDEGDTKHYFESHNNVLNLDFDDISTDVMYNGHRFKTMSMEQAEKTVEFIEEMVDRDVDEIKIHCRAGYSRSRAVAEFIYRYCNENGIEVEYEDRNDYTTMLNQGVLRRLNHAYWKKHNINGYADNNVEYPTEMIKPEIVVINR